MNWENPRAYELSKVASETVAGHIAEWSQIPFIGLRFSNILGPDDYRKFPEHWPDAEFGTLLAIDRARAALGFTPQHSWRDHVDPGSS
jgi:hypothetical protein